MESIGFLDDRYPVRTVYTNSSEWSSYVGLPPSEDRRKALQAYLGTPIDQLTYAYETHSGTVLAITSSVAQTLTRINVSDIPSRIGTYDAMVTALPRTMLCILTADCLPLFLYDPQHHVAAIAHCGWRGICNGIASGTVGVMADRFGVNPQHVVAAFGPAICKRCYEVGDELMEAFATRFSKTEVAQIFGAGRDGKSLLDLRAAVTLELRHSGVQPERIHDTGICTFESKAYPSCRRSGKLLAAHQQMHSGIMLV